MNNFLEQKEYIFSKETIESIEDLGGILKQIRIRLLEDGYTIINGKIRDTKCLQIVKKK